MKIYSNGKDRTLTGSFPARFKLLNNGVEVPFIRTGKGSVRLSGDIPFGELDVEEVIKQKTPQPAKLDAQSIAIINKSDFDQIDILSKKLAINQEQMNAHLSALTEHEATLANLETQNAKAIEQTNESMTEMAKVFGKEIQADREKIKATAMSIEQDIAVSSEVLSAKIEEHETAKNPHKITKETIGLDKVENTSDLDKPVSKATQKALDKKADRSDIEDVRKEIKETEKKQERLVRAVDNANLYGGIGGNELPSGGKKGQVLAKKSNKTGDYEWSSAAGGVSIHNDLDGRSANNAHPISSITGLQDALDSKAVPSDISTAISDHNTSETAHSYIRGLVSSEVTNRENADIGLQQQIDAITASSDVKDIVGTYAELQAYDTSTLGNNDIIKVLQDETQDDETTYYRWSTSTETFTLIGAEGPYYTKSEADSTFVPQTRTVNGKALSTDISLDYTDVGAASSAQGSKADTAVQPADLSTVATTGSYNDLLNKPTIPTINSTNNYVPYRSGSSAFSNSTLMYNSSAMAFTGKLHVGSTSPGSYSDKGRFTIYDNTPSQQVSSIALLNYGGGGGCGVAIDMYNTSANGGIPSGKFGLVDNGNYSGYLQLQVKKSGAASNPLLPAMNIVPVPAANSLTTCVSFGQDEFNRVLFDLHKPEASCTITDTDKRWGGSGTTYSVTGSNKFNPRLLVAIGDIVSFDNFSTEATVTGVVSNSTTCQITVNQTLGTISNKNISVKKAYFKITDENNNTKIYVDPYGKFGIGTGTPSTELDVAGTINASTDVKINGKSVALPIQTGQNGKFLTTDGTDASWDTVDALPSQTGQSGKFLTTDGSTASWSNVESLPSQTGNSGKYLTTDGTDASWAVPKTHNLFDFMWRDSELSDMSWLRADTYSWQDGTVYSDAYNHLVDDIDGKTATSETIGSYTISYYLADDGHKITTDEATVLNIYNESGVAWYYVLDTVNQRFKLPRTKYGFTGLRDTVGKYVEAGLPDIVGGTGMAANSTPTSGFFGTYNTGTTTKTNVGGTPNNTSWEIQGKASKYNSIYGNSNTVQPPATQMYLYFYVGQFSQSATEQTAGLNSELFNGKVDLNAQNLSSAGKSLIAGLGMPSNTYEDLTLLASGQTYTAPSNGYVAFAKYATGGNQHISIRCNGFVSFAWAHVASINIFTWMPVKKGDIYTVTYTAAGTNTDNYFRFIYAVGSESEVS